MSSTCACPHVHHHQPDCPNALEAPCAACGADSHVPCAADCIGLAAVTSSDKDDDAPITLGVLHGRVAHVAAADDASTCLRLGDVDCPTAPSDMPAELVCFIRDLSASIAKHMITPGPRVTIASAIVVRDVITGDYETELALDDITFY